MIFGVMTGHTSEGAQDIGTTNATNDHASINDPFGILSGVKMDSWNSKIHKTPVAST